MADADAAFRSAVFDLAIDAECREVLAQFDDVEHTLRLDAELDAEHVTSAYFPVSPFVPGGMEALAVDARARIWREFGEASIAVRPSV